MSWFYLDCIFTFLEQNAIVDKFVYCEEQIQFSEEKRCKIKFICNKFQSKKLSMNFIFSRKILDFIYLAGDTFRQSNLNLLLHLQDSDKNSIWSRLLIPSR